MIDLYYWPTPNGHKITIFLEEAGLDYTIKPVDISAGDQFETYLRDTFDYLYAEGADTPKMMSVGLHCRIAGKPGRTVAVQRFLEHVLAHQDVWLCRRIDIARHWHEHHPPA